MSPESSETRVAAALAEHAWSWSGGTVRCLCGWEDVGTTGKVRNAKGRAHVAAALATAGLLADPAPTVAIEAALAKVDRTWGGAAMVVRDTVLSILGHRCTNEFCEHDHAAIRTLRAPQPADHAGEPAGEGM